MAEIIDLLTYQNKVLANKNSVSIDNEENFLHYLLWEQTQSPSELIAAKDSITSFFEQKSASVHQFVRPPKKTA
jgi:hypothetical protein